MNTGLLYTTYSQKNNIKLVLIAGTEGVFTRGVKHMASRPKPVHRWVQSSQE